MHPIIHSLNISTLATWLSVAGFGTVGVTVLPYQRPDSPPVATLETTLSDADFLIGDVENAAQPEGGGSGLATIESPEIAAMEDLPTPPELPELAKFAPLPEIPALPEISPTVAPRVSSTSGAAATRDSSRPKASHRAGTGRVGSALATASGGGGAGGGMSQAARLAAGRMPAPIYPAECRRKGQTGTVIVEFTVDSSGRVISAHAKKPSPWPLLDHEAVRTVRKWKFPPGEIMKLQRPIVFQLR